MGNNNNVRRCVYSDGDKEDLHMEQLLYWNDKYKIDPVHLENKDTDPNIDFENINQSFNSTSSSKENNEQKKWR